MEKPLELLLGDACSEEAEISRFDSALEKAEAYLQSEQDPFGGWVRLPEQTEPAELAEILKMAEQIRNQCETLVVIGIGGSYLGARAALEMLEAERGSERSQRGPEILFAGQNLSGTYHHQLLQKLSGKEVCLLVISKSGTTTETRVAFALLKDWLIQRYGAEQAARRIYAITDATKGELRAEAVREGYPSLVVPDNIGGRYSVLSAVGLLPIAVAGIDIANMISGAVRAMQHTDMAKQYAAVRNILYRRGRIIEVFEYYEPSLRFLGEWLKQLFGESEGKNGLGIFPASLEFTTDLHSMGQFLQEGNPVLFETVLALTEPAADLVAPATAGDLLAGLSLNHINRAATDGVISAHRTAKVPIIRLNVHRPSAFQFGQLVYFFEYACALSGLLLGVDPFNQPGVEYYKTEMRNVLLKKEGSEL